MTTSEVVEITASDLVWPFTAGQSDYPHFSPRESHAKVDLDPFPCYAHDLDEVGGALARCESACPPQTWLRYYVSHFEGPALLLSALSRRRELMYDSLFPAAPDDAGEPLVDLPMTREAARRFAAALGYGAAVAEANVENAGLTPDTAETVRGHAEMLRWGQARVAAMSRTQESER